MYATLFNPKWVNSMIRGAHIHFSGPILPPGVLSHAHRKSVAASTGSHLVIIR